MVNKSPLLSSGWCKLPEMKDIYSWPQWARKKNLISRSFLRLPWRMQFLNKWSIADLSRTEGLVRDQTGNYLPWWAEEARHPGQHRGTNHGWKPVLPFQVAVFEKSPNNFVHWDIHRSGCVFRIPPFSGPPTEQIELLMRKNVFLRGLGHNGVAGKPRGSGGGGEGTGNGGL